MEGREINELVEEAKRLAMSETMSGDDIKSKECTYRDEEIVSVDGGSHCLVTTRWSILTLLVCGCKVFLETVSLVKMVMSESMEGGTVGQVVISSSRRVRARVSKVHATDNP